MEITRARVFRQEAVRARKANRRRLWLLLGGFSVVTVFLFTFHVDGTPFMRFWRNGNVWTPRTNRKLRLVSREDAKPPTPTEASELSRLRNQQQSSKVQDGRHSTGSDITLGSCHNSQTGPYYVVDDLGSVCERRHLDKERHGCCRTGSDQAGRPLSWRHGHVPGAKMCNRDTLCCRVYEHCVAMCLDKSLEKTVKRLFNKVSSPHYSTEVTTFEFCRAQCRTSSKNTEHENTYKSEFRFCIDNAPNY